MNAPNGSFIALPPDVGDMWERFTSLQVDYEYHEHTLYTNPTAPTTAGDVITEQRDGDIVESQTFSRVSVKTGATNGEFTLGLSRTNQASHELQVELAFTPVVNTTAGTYVIVTFYVPGFPLGTSAGGGNIPTSMATTSLRRLRDDEMASLAPGEIGFRAGRSGVDSLLGELFDYTDLLSGSPVTISKTTTYPNTTGSVVESFTIQLS